MVSAANIFPHEKIVSKPMHAINIFSYFKGVFCNDHWKPYFKYKPVEHLLCTAYYLKELLRAYGQCRQLWAQDRHHLLISLNKKVSEPSGFLSINPQREINLAYKAILIKLK